MSVIRGIRRALWLATGAWLAMSVAAAQEAPSGAAALHAQFRSIDARPGLGGLPLHVRVEEDKDLVRGEFHVSIPRSFTDVAALLRRGGEWCEIASLHLNIKACTHESSGELTRLTFYAGTKHYQPPHLSRAYVYDLRVESQAAGYIALILTPDAERQATGAYPMIVEAIAVGGNRTFLRLHYRQRLATLMRLAADGYFATFGRSKIGFSVAGTDREGKPVYARDLPGAIERNAVRYYLALQAYLESLDGAPGGRAEQRMNRWFDLTERYPQLRELDKAVYLDNKTRERNQQALLQQELDGRRIRHGAAPAAGGR
jgi:hypothetical protein